MATRPDEVPGLPSFRPSPRSRLSGKHLGQRVVALATVYDGPADEGERITLPLRKFGEPLLDFSGAHALPHAPDAL